MSDRTTRPGAKARFWRDAGWWAVTAAFMLNGLLFGAWAARVPVFKEGFALDPATLGLLLLALAGGAIVAFPFSGALTERWGPERVTIGCAMIYCPALVGLSLAPTPLLFGAALFVFGAMHGAMDVAMNGWAARVERRLEQSVMSIFHAMFSLGAGLGAASGFVAVQMGLAPFPHFLFVALIGGVSALILMIPQRGEMPARRAAEDGPRNIFILPKGRLLLVGLIAFASSMGEGAMADWSAVFLEAFTTATEAQAALGYAVFSVTMVLTRLAGGAVVQRFGPVGATRASGIIACIGLVIVMLTGNLWVALAGFALVGIGYAVLMPLVFSRAANDPEIAPGPALASVATVGYGGLLLGPPVVGFVAQLAGLRASFGLLALLVLGAVLMAPLLRVAPAHSGK